MRLPVAAALLTTARIGPYDVRNAGREVRGAGFEPDNTEQEPRNRSHWKQPRGLSITHDFAVGLTFHLKSLPVRVPRTCNQTGGKSSGGDATRKRGKGAGIVSHQHDCGHQAMAAIAAFVRSAVSFDPGAAGNAGINTPKTRRDSRPVPRCRCCPSPSCRRSGIGCATAADPDRRWHGAD